MSPFQHLAQQVRRHGLYLDMPDSIGQHKMNLAALYLLILFHTVKYIGRFGFRQVYWKAECRKQRRLAVPHPRSAQPQPLGKPGGEDHPDRDRLSVSQFSVAGGRLQGMADRMAVI